MPPKVAPLITRGDDSLTLPNYSGVPYNKQIIGSFLATAGGTMTGQTVMNQANNESALKIVQTGDTGDTPSTGGAININNTGNDGSAFVINTAYGGTRQDALMYINVSNATWDGPILRIISESTDSEGQIRIDAPTPEIEFVETDQTTPAGKWEIRVQEDKFQINSRATTDDTFEKMMTCKPYREGAGIAVGMASEAITAHLQIADHSGASLPYVQLNTSKNSTDGDIMEIDASGAMTMIGPINISGATAATMNLTTSGAGDPKIKFQTTNTDNEISIFLDESETNNHLFVDGSTLAANVDTYLNVRAKAGENAYITAGNATGASNKGSMLYSSGNVMRLRNHLANADLRFQVDSGAGAVDLLSLDASTMKVGIHTTSPDSELQVVGNTKMGDDNTNYMRVGSSGDVIFVGHAGFLFGSLYGHELTKSIPTSGGAYITISGASMWTAGPTNTVNQSASNGSMTVTEPGRYKVDWSLSCESAVASQDIDVDLFINEVEQSDGSARKVLGAGSAKGNMGASAILDCADNDVITLRIKNNTSNNAIIIYNANFNVLHIGGT